MNYIQAWVYLFCLLTLINFDLLINFFGDFKYYNDLDFGLLHCNTINVDWLFYMCYGWISLWYLPWNHFHSPIHPSPQLNFWAVLETGLKPVLFNHSTFISSNLGPSTPNGFERRAVNIYFHWKILALAGIWTRDLHGTKPICSQLSYLGLDHAVNIVLKIFGNF